MALYDYSADLIPMFFELGVIIVSNIILGLILRIYLEKRKQITLIFFFSFLGILLSIICSFTPKIVKVLYGETLTLDQMLGSPGTPMNWFLVRLFDWKISLMVYLFGIYGFSIFGEITFFEGNGEKGYPKTCFIFLIIGIVIELFVYIPKNAFSVSIEIWGIFQGISFSYVIFYAMFVFIPILIRSLKIYHRRESLPVQKRVLGKQFIHIALMAMFFILVVVSFGLDQLMTFLTTQGYTVFYYLAWIFAILALLTTYLGYILPYVKLYR